MIDGKDISVVVQGTVEDVITKKCLESVRKYLPAAELILSTWEGCNVYELDFDAIVINTDPGSEVFENCKNPKQYNLNRILLSSQAGIQKANRKYILKCRSDSEMVGTGFIERFEHYPKRNAKYVLSNNRIVIGSIYSHRYQRQDGYTHPTPYYITDWYCFGLKEDIKMLYVIPLVNTHEFAKYYEIHHRPRDFKIKWMNRRLWRFPPEQYIGVCFAKRKFPSLEFNDCLSYDKVDLNIAEQFIINNFIILNPMDYGIVLNKWPYDVYSRNIGKVNIHSYDGMYRTYVYERLYKKYCDRAYKISASKDPDKQSRIGWMKENNIMPYKVQVVKNLLNYIIK